MGGSAKVIMGATLIMVVVLAMVLGLVFVLLAELYCSLLLRRKRHHRGASFVSTPPLAAATSSNNSTTSEPPPQHQSGHAPSLSNFYSQGVLQAPRNFLFPSVSNLDNTMQDLEKQNVQPQKYPPHVRHAFSSPTSPTSFTPLGSPKIVHEIPAQYCNTSTYYDSIHKEQLMYICNPIYDNEAGRISQMDTPFETPDTSPSRFEDGDEDEEDINVHQSPPLTPMKKLPSEACSISLKNMKALLGTSGSDYSCSNNNDCPSSSSSASPCTSPSW
ncbi:hypothetical protein Leryth_026074 [Lithospermum erythrorhizon]|nr:hypothetical protein Leryth_026074 [Lithospermum erythrorhizon]